jgi:hypothetical protein
LGVIFVERTLGALFIIFVLQARVTGCLRILVCLLKVNLRSLSFGVVIFFLRIQNWRLLFGGLNRLGFNAAVRTFNPVENLQKSFREEPELYIWL